MMDAQQYLKLLLGIAVGILLTWIGVTGRLGSLLGAVITPGYMAEGAVAVNRFATESKDPNATPLTGSMTLTSLQIGALAYNAGVVSTTALTLAIAIALAESGGRLDSHNPGNAAIGDVEDSWGLWQINVLAHPNYDKKQLVQGAYNATAMYIISSGGTNWQPWGTYTGGNYRQYLSQAQQAASTVIQGNAGK